MFDTSFTFSNPTSPRCDARSSRSVSPCSSTAPLSTCSSTVPLSTFPSPPQTPFYSMTDLVADFAGQAQIRQRAQMFYDSCDSYANTDLEGDWSIPAASTAPTTTSSSARSSRRSSVHRGYTQTAYPSSRRAQRQLQTRMLCASSSHRSDIAALVARMVEQRSQCSVSPPVDNLALMTEVDDEDNDEGGDIDDEGYGSNGDGTSSSSLATSPVLAAYSPASSRRSSVAKAVRMVNRRDGGKSGATCVSKSVRIKSSGLDKGQHRRRRTGEVA